MLIVAGVIHCIEYERHNDRTDRLTKVCLPFEYKSQRYKFAQVAISLGIMAVFLSSADDSVCFYKRKIGINVTKYI